MARKAGFGSRREPVTGTGRTCVLWALVWARDQGGGDGLQGPPNTGRSPSRLAEVEELSGPPRERAACGGLLLILSPLKRS